MRYRLRTLFVAVTAIAIGMAWLVAQRKWVQDRQEARDWAQGSTECNIRQAGTKRQLPIGLRILGAAPARYVYEIDVDGLDPSEMYRVAQLRDLFPEATVVVKHSGRRRGKQGFVAVLISEITELTRAIKAWVEAARTQATASNDHLDPRTLEPLAR